MNPAFTDVFWSSSLFHDTSIHEKDLLQGKRLNNCLQEERFIMQKPWWLQNWVTSTIPIHYLRRPRGPKPDGITRSTWPAFAWCLENLQSSVCGSLVSKGRRNMAYNSKYVYTVTAVCNAFRSFLSHVLTIQTLKSSKEASAIIVILFTSFRYYACS